MRVDTKILWDCFWQMKHRIERMEEILEEVGNSLEEHREEWGEEATVLKDRMEKELFAQVRLCWILERIVRNYEQTGNRLLQIQEDGMQEPKPLRVENCDLSSVKLWMERWNLLGRM